MAGPLIPADSPVLPSDLNRRKLDFARSRGTAVPSNVEWLRSLPPGERERLAPFVRRKPSRTLSGVAIVAVMTAPAPCPHGVCAYCPGGVANGSPQSYTGEEPSALRGAQFGWDARAIVEHRLATLTTIGHPTSKVEVIVMGGTFPSRPPAYREATFRRIFEGLNGVSSASLEAAQRANESAEHRCVSLTVETRPDWCDGRVLPSLLDAGVTRVEIGVECLTESVLRASGRAHGVEEVATATREARDRGLKVAYHLMLGLPGMTPERDLADVGRVFADERFRPDMIKLYPTLVIPSTRLHDDWRAGRYEPYDAETAVNLLADIKAGLPPWVRVQRIQRDIPARLVAAGVRRSNLRELAQARLRDSGRSCRCLRCREVGRGGAPPADAFRPTCTAYRAAGGEERFLAWEDPATDTVAGFLRLRLPSSATDGGVEDPVIRELKVLGPELAVAAAPGPTQYQHRGFGRALVAAAEREARESGYRRLLVLSAVGTRAYYRRLGFEGAGPHLAKPLFA